MERPSIHSYASAADYVRDMIRFRKQTESDFSVLRATKSLRKMSPTLVSLVAKGKRSLTVDRVDEFAKLLKLNVSEKFYLRKWVDRVNEPPRETPSRRDVGTGLMNDWLNIYVKDFFHLEAVQKNPELIETALTAVAPASRVRRAMEFLRREGHLRRTLDGKLVLESRLDVAESPTPSRKIRQFHKGALGLAKLALDLYSKEERLANTVTLTLDEKSHAELRELIEEFAEKLKDFVARHPEPGNRLYQLILNLSPIGGKLE